ncbi:hypothetical protein BGX38DRAFT_397717 [Terfezia claveryi]|nr:hypothetical protein BGX38DRAFT_397717 [Terfezia claveryi]
MGRPRHLTQKATQAATQESSGHIKWDKSLDERLAVRLIQSWKQWEMGNKTQISKGWAQDLGIALDPRGLRTKNHILTMLKHYNEAKELGDKTGAGEIEEEQVDEDGKVVIVKVSVLAQQKRKCRTFEILDPMLGQRHGNAKENPVGLDEGGIRLKARDRDMDDVASITSSTFSQSSAIMGTFVGDETGPLFGESLQALDEPVDPLDLSDVDQPPANQSSTNTPIEKRVQKMSKLFGKKGNEPGGRGGNKSGTRGQLDIPPMPKKRTSAKLTIDDEVTLDNFNPGMASSKRPRVMSNRNSFSKPADFMGIWEENTKSRRDKYEAAKLKYIVQTDPQFIREREKDRHLEIEKTQIEKLRAENERNMILIRQYEIAASLNKDIEEVFPGALALAKGKAAVAAAEPRGPLSNVLDGVLSRNGRNGNRGCESAVVLNRNVGMGSWVGPSVVAKGSKPTPKLSLSSRRLQDRHTVNLDEIEDEKENIEEIDDEDGYDDDDDELN